MIYSYQQGLVSILNDVCDAPQEKGQCLFKLCRICLVEDKVHAERCDKGFIHRSAGTHLNSFDFDDTLTLSGEFSSLGLSVEQLDMELEDYST